MIAAIPRRSLKHLALLCLTPLAAACSPVAMINRLTPTDTYVFRGGIAYGSAPRERLDVYQPITGVRNPQPAAGYPVVVFFYGGSWNSGNRAMYKFVGEALAARGIVTVIADYRLYPEVRYPAFLRDNARAVAWTYQDIAQYGGNPHQLYVMGHSAGGYNAAMLALDPRWLEGVGMKPAMLAGWIGLAGPYDFLPITDRAVQPVFHFPDYPAGCMPIDHVHDAQVPRTFIGAAKVDSLVNPQRNSVQLADKLKADGAQVTLDLYTGVNHETLIGSFAKPLRWMSPVLHDVVAFVRQGSRQPAADQASLAPAAAARRAIDTEASQKLATQAAR
ncbi:MAG: alpha/beta hydrolase [Burkholderiales bacterium]|nr:alpha/beta hydrolase [Burkholderiales bacterium]